MRIRTIKPEFWTDGFIVQLPYEVRLAFVALWNAADDHGFIREEPERLRLLLFPSDITFSMVHVLDLLVATDRLIRFETPEGKRILRVANWQHHQKVDHPAPSKIAVANSKKVAIPHAVRRALAMKYGCEPGGEREAQCYYCGSPGSIYWWRLSNGKPSGWVTFTGLEMDHFIAEANGGKSEPENLVLACQSCNRGKRTGDPVMKIREDSRGLARTREDGVPPSPAPRSPETDQGRASDPGIPPDSRPLQAETPPPLHHEPPPAPKSLKTPPTASRPVAFDPPTRQQLIDFLVDEWGVKHAEQIGMDSADRVGVEMDKFLDHFAALGWRMKSGPMRDWKAAFRNWIRRVPDFAPDPPASRRRGR